MLRRLTIILLVTAVVLVVANVVQLVTLLEANQRAQQLIEQLEARR